jgi:hypothetical protein
VFTKIHVRLPTSASWAEFTTPVTEQARSLEDGRRPPVKLAGNSNHC